MDFLTFFLQSAEHMVRLAMLLVFVGAPVLMAWDLERNPQRSA